MKRLKWGRSTNSPTNSSPTILSTTLSTSYSTTLCQKIDIKDKLLIISLHWKELIWSEHQNIFIVRCGCRPVELFFFLWDKTLKECSKSIDSYSRNRYPINGNNELMLCFHDFQGWGKKVTMLSALKLHPLISCKQQSRMRVINLRQHRMSETLVWNENRHAEVPKVWVPVPQCQCQWG